jgi:hypothetical protein
LLRGNLDIPVPPLYVLPREPKEFRRANAREGLNGEARCYAFARCGKKSLQFFGGKNLNL